MITFLTWTAIIAVVLLAIVGFGVVTFGIADYLNHSKEVKSLLPPHLIPYDHPPEVLAELYDDEALSKLLRALRGLSGDSGIRKNYYSCSNCGGNRNGQGKRYHEKICLPKLGSGTSSLIDQVKKAQKLRDFNEATADIQFAFDKEIRA